MTIELRQVRQGDAQILFDAWASYPENFAYLTASVCGSASDAERYLEALQLAPRNMMFHIIDSDANAVGAVKAALTEHRAQIGYVIHQPFWGKGFASAALQQLLERLRGDSSIKRIWATCAMENHASIRVLEKCGFEREAILKNWVTYPAQGGRPFDNYSYVIIP